MKKILLSAVLASSVFANDNYIEFGGGYIDEKNSFSTNSDKKISSLGSAKSDKSGVPIINLYYGIPINTSSKIYISSNYADTRVGSQLSFDNSFLDFGLKGSFGNEAWKNPYLTNKKREKTDVKEIGAYIGYAILPSQDIETMIRYEYTKKSYGKDQLKGDLKREGRSNYLAFENTFFSGNISYAANLNFEKFDADGKANSFDKYGLEVGVSTQISDAVRLTFLANYGNKDYKNHNSAVNKKVKVKLYGSHAILNWEKPLGYQNFYTFTNVGYQKEEANANFFDKETTYALAGLGYRF